MFGYVDGCILRQQFIGIMPALTIGLLGQNSSRSLLVISTVSHMMCACGWLQFEVAVHWYYACFDNRTLRTEFIKTFDVIKGACVTSCLSIYVSGDRCKMSQFHGCCMCINGCILRHQTIGIMHVIQEDSKRRSHLTVYWY